MPEFLDQREKIREYVRWTLRGDGPAYYQVPTPQTCNVARDDPGYIVRRLFSAVFSVLPVHWHVRLPTDSYSRNS